MVGLRAQKGSSDRLRASCAALLCRPICLAVGVVVTSVEVLLQGESLLLHKYDGLSTHPESFQRISNLSGKRNKVK
ncbi:hypothetical protein B2J69_04990 [Pantoea latae]|uniref:Uncharacterized protein n=1 Tax=Pantoea latae TaxID=1964541 RepID=A0A1V9DNM0_9GAMM|nr:hypothetical protein B2J69_04990 [Pantoea latae]